MFSQSLSQPWIIALVSIFGKEVVHYPLQTKKEARIHYHI